MGQVRFMQNELGMPVFQPSKRLDGSLEECSPDSYRANSTWLQAFMNVHRDCVILHGDIMMYLIRDGLNNHFKVLSR